MDEVGLAAVAALNDPVRRALYVYVASKPGPIGRAEAAKAAKVSTTLAAFHLDKLVEEGLLRASYRRLSGRSGPGAGRPAKVYERSDRAIEVTIPSRDYRTLADLLARRIDDGASAAYSFGKEIGAEARERAGRNPSQERLVRSLETVLRERGYEPFRTAPGEIRLRNCPFDALAKTHTDLVCGTNLEMMRGILAGARATGVRAALDPQPGLCCVAFRTGSRR